MRECGSGGEVSVSWEVSVSVSKSEEQCANARMRECGSGE
jgi:hypothetical protein